MADLKGARAALILVDLQKGFEDIAYWGGERNNPEAEYNAGEILKLWRALDLPVYHVKHCSRNPVSPLRETHEGNAFLDVTRPRPGEPVIKKNVNSAFIGTDLQQQLDRRGVSKIVVVCLTTDHCISATVRMAGNLGYETYLISDATATFNKKGPDGKNYSAELIHETALASLNDEFATVLTMKNLLSLL